jgi:hypothetical protein
MEIWKDIPVSSLQKPEGNKVKNTHYWILLQANLELKLMKFQNS